MHTDIEFEKRIKKAQQKGLNLWEITDNDKNDGNLASKYFADGKTFICFRHAIEHLLTKYE